MKLNKVIPYSQLQSFPLVLLPYVYSFCSLAAQMGKNLPAKQTGVQSLGREYPLKKALATCSSIPAWRIPRTEEPGGLQSIGSQSWTQLSN